ncbi:MAG: RluA family pseudouridine synthase [Halofilum sp. (in: g-proteobacteria)]
MTETAAARPKVRIVEVEPDDAGQRVDNYLLRVLRGVPRSRVYRLLRRGEVRVNGGRVRASRRLAAGDRVRLPPVHGERYAEGRLPPGLLARLRDATLYEDEQALVLDKPAGIAVHAGTGLGGGLIDGLRELRPDVARPELVHRLDRDTSGCLLIAKGRSALRRLQDELRAGGFEKIYHAVLLGDWAGPRTTVDARLQRYMPASGERLVRADPAGRSARSHFERIGGADGLTLVEVRIETGRTHQIRVHAAGLGHPVAGDAKYGVRERERALFAGGRAPRLLLHASGLGFTGTNGWVRVDSALPLEFDAVRAGLITRD